MMMLVNRIASRLLWSRSRVTNTSMLQITAIETMKISSWPYGTDDSASVRTTAPNASPPPRMRQSIGRRSTVSALMSRTPLTEIAGMISPSKNTVSRGMKPASQPDIPATARMPADSDSRPRTCTMPRSARMSGSGRSPPVSSRRDTTSVDIASATTSCTTVPMTISSAPSR